jgi:hypothetical protein
MQGRCKRTSVTLTSSTPCAIPSYQWNQPYETRILFPKSAAVLRDLETNQKALQGSCGAGLDGMPLP